MLAAALTEVLNVLPILAKRVGVEGRLLFYSLLLYLESNRLVVSLDLFRKVGGNI